MFLLHPEKHLEVRHHRCFRRVLPGRHKLLVIGSHLTLHPSSF